MRAGRMREGLRHATVLVVLVASAAVAGATDWLPPYVVGGQVTVVYQFIVDPGDNAARGPVSVVSLRLHVQQVAGHD